TAHRKESAQMKQCRRSLCASTLPVTDSEIYPNLKRGPKSRRFSVVATLTRRSACQWQAGLMKPQRRTATRLLAASSFRNANPPVPGNSFPDPGSILEVGNCSPGTAGTEPDHRC